MNEAQEARAAELLAEFGEVEPPHRRDLVASVSRDARWQRQVRHVLVSIGGTAGGIGSGLAWLARGGRR